MNNHSHTSGAPSGADAEAVGGIYRKLLEAWNSRSAAGMAELFEADGNVVGFDGSPVNGREEIESAMAAIFASHPTGAYVSKIREVRFPLPEVGMVRAIAGMVPQDGTDINPAVNAIQTLVAVRHDDGWRIALFQNTPAQFHGRPELAAQMTAELRELL
ncbi:MAG TPA: SgcJ/EcaC family oxidoreductase [Candidatus Kapabacteria bacterium]|nr:SgcJ/EcaC family oxidoreductase [Candidatus Kapabacteria bacterium]